MPTDRVFFLIYKRINTSMYFINDGKSPGTELADDYSC